MTQQEETQPIEQNVVTPAPVKRKKAKRQTPQGLVHIMSSFNNTIVTVTDPAGAVLATASAGSSGFHGTKKGTAFAAQIAAEKALTIAKQQNGISKVDVFVRGIGQGRESAIRTLVNSGITVNSLTDVTGIPHGGVRPRKARRV